MIKINLASRKQSSATGADSKVDFSRGLGASLAQFNIDPELLKQLPLKRVGLVLLTAFGANYLLTDYKEGELKKLDAQIAKSQAEVTKLQADLNKTKSYSALKKALDADEILIRSKIETVQKLVADRQTPPKMLGTLSSGIPSEVWLSDFKILGDDVNLKGTSVGFNQISDFMKTLTESAYFAEVRLINTQQAHDELGTDVAAFEIAGKKRKGL